MIAKFGKPAPNLTPKTMQAGVPTNVSFKRVEAGLKFSGCPTHSETNFRITSGIKYGFSLLLAEATLLS